MSEVPRPLVLACEDEERIIELLRTLTEPLGVDLIAARDGATALAYLAAKRPALMTLDLVLPTLDGFGVLERVRQMPQLDDLPIMVISALSDVNNIKRAYGYGVVDYVAKPFNVDLLDAKLKVFLRLRKLQDELRDRQKFLEEVVDHVSSGLIVVDADSRIVKVNAAGAAQVHRDPHTLLGHKVGEVLPGAEAMFLVSGDAAQRRVAVQTPDGERQLGFTNAPVEVSGRMGAVAVFRALSDVEAAQREKDERTRREELAQSARSFAHEVRNPLAAVGAAAQVVGKQDIEDPMRMRLARAIEGEASRITRLVQEYVERRAVPSVERPVDVKALLDEVVEVNLLASPARSRISIECADALPQVKADADRLKQVVLNLVLNAVNATESGGTITLKAAKDAGGVALRVCDTGHGIAEQDLPRIFDENFSTRRGGGLGLPIARRIVEAHGGAIRVESTAGRGTTFTVWLPGA
ncbi:MAG TPA: ATP-binding protein [Polyangia bacterium]|nr:ATP-binding protein [Polyangia bacterium]